MDVSVVVEENRQSQVRIPHDSEVAEASHVRQSDHLGEVESVPEGQIGRSDFEQNFDLVFVVELLDVDNSESDVERVEADRVS